MVGVLLLSVTQVISKAAGFIHLSACDMVILIAGLAIKAALYPTHVSA